MPTGAPSGVYKDEIKIYIEADVVLPKFAEVGNAVGALMGKGIKRIEIMLKPVREKKRKRLFFYPGGREEFSLYDDAIEYAKNLGHRLIIDYMEEAGLDKSNIKIDMHKNDINLNEGTNVPVETTLTFIGVGTSESEK
ncbi:MAG: hypothetical protein ACLFMM_07960 [Methanohalobium sp.]|uniref:hypothetical protein n=1 Tax=Methanohalobium sp. TaxID=2837493 RepID=UPI00397E20A3